MADRSGLKKRTLQQARNHLDEFVVEDRDESSYETLEQPLLASSDMARLAQASPPTPSWPNW
jgi:hypothetical protein